MLWWKQRLVEHKQEEVFLEKKLCSICSHWCSSHGQTDRQWLQPLGHTFRTWAWNLGSKIEFYPKCLFNKWTQTHCRFFYNTKNLPLFSISRRNYWPFFTTAFLKQGGIITTILKQLVRWKILASLTLVQNTNSVYCEIVLFVGYFHWLAVPVPG